MTAMTRICCRHCGQISGSVCQTCRMRSRHFLEGNLAGGGPVLGQGGAQGVAGGKMVGPARKREAVGHLQSDLELSQRRACKVVGQPRATQRQVPQPDAEDTRLRARLNE